MTVVVSDFTKYDFDFVSNYDGDSMWIWISQTWDFGFNKFINAREKVNVRLLGVDTPELRDKRPDWKAAAILARNFVTERLEDYGMYFLSKEKPDKYGRALGDFEMTNGELLSQALIDNCLGVRYEGQNKADIESLHAHNINLLKSKGMI